MLEHSGQEPLWSRLSAALGAQMGLHFPKERWADLERGIAAAASAFGMASAQGCARWLLSEPLTRSRIEVLAQHLTIGETYFFRDRRSFEILEKEILPSLRQARAGTERRLRIWSAGCCTGEEPYSIAMLLAMTMPDLRDWNVSILATDIDPGFLRKASLGVYGHWSFRDAPQGIRDRFFQRTKEGRFAIAPGIREMVRFDYLNLAQDEFPSADNGISAMDIVLCRNVLMYFEPARARAILQKLGGSLQEGGWLLVSPAEIPHATLPGLVPVNFPGAIVHRKDSRPGARKALPPAAPPAVVPVAPPIVPAPAAPRVAGKRAPAPPPAPSPLQEAEALYEQGHYAEAVAALLRIVSQGSGHAAAMALLARIHANRGRLSEASAWCAKALEADKLNAGWRYLHATILLEQGLAEEAAAALGRALYLDPDHALAHFALGNMDRRQGKLDDARRHFRNALSILDGYGREQVLPESDGLTAGTLAEIIRAAVSREVHA